MLDLHLTQCRDQGVIFDSGSRSLCDSISLHHDHSAPCQPMGFVGAIAPPPSAAIRQSEQSSLLTSFQTPSQHVPFQSALSLPSLYSSPSSSSDYHLPFASSPFAAGPSASSSSSHPPSNLSYQRPPRQQQPYRQHQLPYSSAPLPHPQHQQQQPRGQSSYPPSPLPSPPSLYFHLQPPSFTNNPYPPPTPLSSSTYPAPPRPVSHRQYQPPPPSASSHCPSPASQPLNGALPLPPNRPSNRQQTCETNHQQQQLLALLQQVQECRQILGGNI